MVRVDTQPTAVEIQTKALVSFDAFIDILFRADLLCDLCEERPWTQAAQWHEALLCASCAEGEPEVCD